MFIDSEWNSAMSVYEGPKKTDTILNRNPRMASSYIELRVWYDRYKRYTLLYKIRYRILYILFVLQSRQKKKSSIIVNYIYINNLYYYASKRKSYFYRESKTLSCDVWHRLRYIGTVHYQAENTILIVVNEHITVSKSIQWTIVLLDIYNDTKTFGGLNGEKGEGNKHVTT